MTHDKPKVLVLKRPTDKWPNLSGMWRGWCYECVYETQFWNYGATLGVMLQHRQKGCGFHAYRGDAEKTRLPIHGRALRDVGEGRSGEVARRSGLPSDVPDVPGALPEASTGPAAFAEERDYLESRLLGNGLTLGEMMGHPGGLYG